MSIQFATARQSQAQPPHHPHGQHPHHSAVNVASNICVVQLDSFTVKAQPLLESENNVLPKPDGGGTLIHGVAWNTTHIGIVYRIYKSPGQSTTQAQTSHQCITIL